MKVLNNTCVEVLPALLEFFETKGKSGKCQTIRSAWSVLEKTHNCFRGIKLAPIHHKEIISMPASCKVGDKRQMHWKSRGTPTDAMFCKLCGERACLAPGIGHYCPKKKCENDADGDVFSKRLGVVEITDVFKVVMSKYSEKGVPFVDRSYTIQPPLKKRDGNLEQRDGFKNFDEFFNYFDKAYDLSVPKPFWVNRYKYISGGV